MSALGSCLVLLNDDSAEIASVVSTMVQRVLGNDRELELGGILSVWRRGERHSSVGPPTDGLSRKVERNV